MNDVAEQAFAGHVPGGENDDDAGSSAGSGDVNAADEGTRNCCAQHGGVEHARNLHVVDKLAGAEEFFRRVNPGCARAYASGIVGRVRGGTEAVLECGGREVNRLLDFGIAGAAAEVVTNCRLDFRESRRGVLIEQRLRTDQDARHAEAALHCAGPGEGPGKNVAVASGETFGGCDGFAVDLGGGQLACAHRLALHQH